MSKNHVSFLCTAQTSVQKAGNSERRPAESSRPRGCLFCPVGPWYTATAYLLAEYVRSRAAKKTITSAGQTGPGRRRALYRRPLLRAVPRIYETFLRARGTSRNPAKPGETTRLIESLRSCLIQGVIKRGNDSLARSGEEFDYVT